MKPLFWTSLILLIYTYFGYLILLSVISGFKKQKIAVYGKHTPRASFIIAAYNEERTIKEKIEATLRLDYPKDKLEIIVASDASSDKTDEIVRDYAGQGVKLIRNDTRGGKTVAQNLAVKEAEGEVLIFSDATTVYKKDALRKLVRHFSDELVGCVGGEEVFKRSVYGGRLTVDGKEKSSVDEKDITEEASFFWTYETLLRRKESEISTMIGVSGCIFAIRKELYEELDDGLIEDFTLPLKVISKGYKVVCEEEAIAYERSADDTGTELARKTRIVTGGMNVVLNMKHLLNPFKYPFTSFALVSHKILRWLSPFFMIALFLSSLYLMEENRLYFAAYVLQLIFYLTGLLGNFTKESSVNPKPVRIIYHFCVMNLAAIFGLVKFLQGERKTIWETVR